MPLRNDSTSITFTSLVHKVHLSDDDRFMLFSSNVVTFCDGILANALKFKSHFDPVNDNSVVANTLVVKKTDTYFVGTSLNLHTAVNFLAGLFTLFKS